VKTQVTDLDIVHQAGAVFLQKPADLKDNTCSLLQCSASPDLENPACQLHPNMPSRKEEEKVKEEEEEGGVTYCKPADLENDV